MLKWLVWGDRVKYYNRSQALLIGIYSHISSLYADKYGNISLSKEKKIRRLINKSYLSQLPLEIQKELSNDVSFADMLEYLKEQNSEYERMLEQRDKKLESVARELCPEDVSLVRMLMTSENLHFLSADDSVEITVSESYSYSCFLILQHVEVAGTLPVDYLHGDCLDYYELSKCGSLYCLELAYYDYDDEYSEKICRITFSGAKSRKERYNGLQIAYGFETPWEYLCSVADELSHCKGAGCELNEMEKDLMPVTEALNNLRSRDWTADYSALYDMAEQVGLIELRRIAAKKLLLKLNDRCYEPLWRFIYSRLEESQAQYPNKADVLCEWIHVEGTRITIVEKLKEYGFAGKYPDFYKASSMGGPKLVASYGQSYFIAHEKNVIHHIKCIESYEGDLRIIFICGTTCLRKDESVKTDTFSCMFNTKGRRSFHTITAECPQTVPEYMEKLPPISDFAEVAAKKASLIKLTKEERKNSWFRDSSGSATMFLIALWIIAGIFLGLCMTAGFIVLEFLAYLIIKGSLRGFLVLFMDTPWWMVFLGCAIPIVGIMSVLTITGNKK